MNDKPSKLTDNVIIGCVWFIFAAFALIFGAIVGRVVLMILGMVYGGG